MTTTTIPIKTPRGDEELRHRALRLGQRHRTMLLLVDGHRTLDEVLSLAKKAGAQSSHFDELVKLELVELPVVEVEPPAPAEVPEPAPVQADHTASAPALPAAEVEAEAVVRSIPLPDVKPPTKPRGRTRRKAPPAASGTLEPLPADALQPVAKPSAEKRRRPAAPAPTADSVAAAALVDEAIVQQVRDLLIDTLRLDTPLFSARMLVRVHGAHSGNELIDLVWEIETHLRHDRRSHNDMQNLQRARELLGMGNTRVKGESQAGALDE
jgi:hypothetical protein